MVGEQFIFPAEWCPGENWGLSNEGSMSLCDEGSVASRPKQCGRSEPN